MPAHPCRLPVVHKAIREFLEAKLRALKLASSEDAVGRDLPGRIILWPPPKDEVEAKLYGILEGLHAAGKITGGEASDWAMRFRSVRVRPGDPGAVFIYPSGQIPAEVRIRNQPWPRDSISLAIEPDTPARDYDTGLLALTRVELYPRASACIGRWTSRSVPRPRSTKRASSSESLRPTCWSSI